ncbi:MAG: endonuclease/exonuclease/phosphatase family protein [Candidatus Eremiobacterota bacterium]
MRVGLIALLAACLCLAGPAPSQEARLRLATWNVRNLFDSVDDPYHDDLLTPAQATAKLEAVAAGIRRLEADVVALQEVEKASVLAELQRSTGYRYAVLVEGNDRARGIDVAFLSRIRAGYRSHREDPLPRVRGVSPDYRFSRDCLEVHLQERLPMVCLINHFKSKARGGRDDDAKRRAQALAVRDLVRRQGERPVAVLGDLNDGPDSWSLEPVMRDAGLVDPLAALALTERFTIRHRGQPLAVDYLLVNATLRPHLVSAQVLHDEVFRTSDHYPVVADFRP